MALVERRGMFGRRAEVFTPVAFASLALLVGAGGIALRAAGATPVPAGLTTGTGAPGVLYRGDQVLPFLQAAGTRRVDIAGIGDSNQISNGDYGHDYGFQLAWTNAFGMYATEVLPATGRGGYAVMGTDYAPGNPYLNDPNDPAIPPQLVQQTLPTSLDAFPNGAGFVAPGDHSLGGPNLYVNGNSLVFDANQTLKWHATYYTFPGASGSLTPQVRGNAGPNYGYSAIQTYPTINIPAGNYTPVDISEQIDPSIWTHGPENWKMYLYDADAGSNSLPAGAMNGPLFSTWQRLENVDHTKGVAYSTLLYQGGRSALHAAEALQQSDQGALAEWMRQATQLQNPDKSQAMLLVQIEHGGNDRNYSDPSVGPNPAPSNTGDGFKDNCQAIINRLRQVWTDSGYDVHNLFFNIGPYHPQEGFVPNLAAFETGAMQLADSTFNVSVTRGTRMITTQTMSADSYYVSTQDHAHLSMAGYTAIGRFAVNQMTSMLPSVDGRSNVSSLTLSFDSAGDAYDPNSLLLDNLTTGKRISTADMSFSFDAVTDTLTYTFPGLPGDVLPTGNYRATLGASVPLSDYSYTFNATPFIVPEPAAGSILGIVAVWIVNRRRRRRPAD